MFSLQKIIVSVHFSFIPLVLSAGDPYLIPAGAAEAGMSYVSVMKSGFWSSFHNQASLVSVEYRSVAISYENRYGIPDLGTGSLAMILPAGRTTLAGLYSVFGNSNYKRHLAGIACAMKLNRIIAAGVQIDYQYERLYGEYNDIQSLTFEAGLLITATENINVGIHLYNPVPNSIRKNELPSSIRTGIGSRIGDGLFTGFEAEIASNGKADLRCGFEFMTVRKLVMRGGFRTYGTSFSFGLGYILKGAVLDLAFSSNESLGITSTASIIFRL